MYSQRVQPQALKGHVAKLRAVEGVLTAVVVMGTKSQEPRDRRPKQTFGVGRTGTRSDARTAKAIPDAIIGLRPT
jgi:hypothetical protein